jgi:hypothetical protein
VQSLTLTNGETVNTFVVTYDLSRSVQDGARPRRSPKPLPKSFGKGVSRGYQAGVLALCLFGVGKPKPPRCLANCAFMHLTYRKNNVP